MSTTKGRVLALVVVLPVASLGVLAAFNRVTTAQNAPVVQSAASPAQLAVGRKVDTRSFANTRKSVAPTSSQPAVPIGLENPTEIQRIKKQLAAPLQSQRFSLIDGQANIQADKATTEQSIVPSAATLNRSFDSFALFNPGADAIPPDPIMATGPSDLIVAVNRAWRIYNKTGGQLFDTSLASWFSNVLPANQTGINVFDPKVIYDRESGRFVLLALARRDSDQFASFLVAVSDNNTATGGWCNYSFNARLNGSTNTSNWADYTNIGNNSNAIILSANMFAFGGGFQYTKLRFLPKAALYNTTCPGVSWWDQWDLRNANNTAAFTVQPALNYFNNTTTDYLINTVSSGTGSQLTLWRAVNTSNTNPQPTLTRQATINVASYSAPPDAEQPGTTTRIDTGDARLLNAVYRGGGLWTTGSTGCNFSGDSATRSCVRWYQINPSNNTVLQSLTWGASGRYYSYPAITADPSNNAWIVFNRTGSTEFASIRHTGRKGTDPVNTLQGSAQLRAGQGCYARLDGSSRNRWGDYNGISWDPSTGRAWIFSEFASGTSSSCGSNIWRTAVGELLLP